MINDGKLLNITFLSSCGYTFTKELFPTLLRTTALSTASAGARVGSLTSPFIAMLDTFHPVLPLLIYGIFVFTAGLWSVWIWPETNKINLPISLEECEKRAASPNKWLRFCTKCCRKEPETDAEKPPATAV